MDDKDTVKYVAEQFAPHLTDVKLFGGADYANVCKHLEEVPALVEPTAAACLGRKPADRAVGPGSLLIHFMQLPPPLHHSILQRHFRNGHLNLQCMLMHDFAKEDAVAWVFADIGKQIAQLAPIRAFNLCMNYLPDGLADTLLQRLAPHTALASLRLRGNCLGAASARTLHLLLTTALTNVQNIDLSDNKLSNADLHQISQAFSTLPRLEHLALVGTGLTGSAAEPFFRQIMRLGGLRTLDLSDNNLGDAGLAALGSVLATTPAVPAVTRLALSRVGCALSLIHISEPTRPY